MNRRDSQILRLLVKKYGIKVIQEKLEKMDGGTFMGFPVILVDNELSILVEKGITFGDFSCYILNN